MWTQDQTGLIHVLDSLPLTVTTRQVPLNLQSPHLSTMGVTVSLVGQTKKWMLLESLSHLPGRVKVSVL